MTEIECSFRQIRDSGTEDRKSGRYSQSMHWEVPDFGSSKWVVLGYIDLPWEKMVNEDYLSQADIIERCLAFLNKTPEKKKYQKKPPTPKFGKLQPYKAEFKKKGDKQFIIVQLITDQHDNENFWREGPLLAGVKIKKSKKEKSETDPLDDQNDVVTLQTDGI